MQDLSEASALIENRENLYALLGRLYRTEADGPLLDQMARMEFPTDCRDEALAAGYGLLQDYLQAPRLDPVTDLAVDFAKTFLGAGVSKNGFAAYPYESVYTSPERLIMQDARDRVVAVYRANGLDRDESLDMPEDHLGLELAFMAHLCGETRRALARGDRPAAAAALEDQKRFLGEHLLNWVPAFCADVGRCSATGFYRGLASLTDGYLRMEQVMIADLADDIRPA